MKCKYCNGTGIMRVGQPEEPDLITCPECDGIEEIVEMSKAKKCTMPETNKDNCHAYDNGMCMNAFACDLKTSWRIKW